MNPRLLLSLLPVMVSAMPPIISLPFHEAWEANNTWNHKGDQYAVSTAAATGSMRPYIQGGEILLLERYTGQPIEVGMWVVRPRWDKPNGVFHAVIVVSKWGYVRTQGTNCAIPDHWYKADRTRYIVRKVIRVLPAAIENANPAMLATK